MNFIITSFRYLILVYLLFSVGMVLGQSRAKYQVISSVSARGLPHVSVMLLHSQDSILYDATFTDNEGYFISNIPDSGSYLLVFSRPNYIEYVVPINLNNQGIPNRRFVLTAKSQLIEEIKVVGNTAVIIKGDTLAFNPENYIVGKNSNVEDLLKQLPGFSIDRQGKIAISGKRIAKLLVDGEEFFGDDPVLATRNLKGFMIDKILTYNLKNNTISFDDQQRKVVDLKIKETYKNGYFGKLSAGLGVDAQQQQAMLNVFKEKMKVSAFYNRSTTEKIGLSWDDSDKFSTTAQRSELSFLGNLVAGDLKEAVVVSSAGDFDGKGLPKSIYTGTHYNNSWNSGSSTLVLNYKLNRLNTVGTQSSTTKHVLIGGDQISTEDIVFDNTSNLHLFSGNYALKLDSSLSMRILVDGLVTDLKTRNEARKSVTEDGKLLSQYSKDYLEDAHEHKINIANFWEKKLSKNNLASLQLNYLKSGNNQQGELSFIPRAKDDLQAFEQQYIAGTAAGNYYHAKLLMQHKTANFIGKVFYELTGFTGNNQLLSKQFIDQILGRVDSLNSGLFTSHQFSNKVSAEGQLSIKKKHILKSALNYVGLRQTVHDRFNGQEQFNKWNRFTAAASWSYQMSKRGRVSLLYNANPVFPSTFEQQRIPYNIDPLSRFVGNLALDPAIAQSIAMLTNIFREINLESFNAQIKLRKVSNPIIQSVRVSDNGYLLTSFVNDPKANYSHSVDVSYARKTNLFGITLGLAPSWMQLETSSLVNGDLISSNNRILSLQASIDKYDKKYNFYFRIRPFNERFKTKDSPLSQSWNVQGSSGFNLYLPKNFSLSTDGMYRFRSANDFIADDFKQMIINLAFSKSFLANENLILSLGCKDLLNKHAGIDRFALANKYVETRYSTIGRYFMGSLTWDFTKMKASKL